MTSTLTLPGGIDWKSDGYFEARAVVAATSAFVMVTGLLCNHPLMLGAGAAGVCMMSRKFEQLFGTRREIRLAQLATRLLRGCGPYDVGGCDTAQSEATSPATEPKSETLGDAIDSTAGLVSEMLRQKRYGLLLRRETFEHLSRNEYRRAIQALDENMAIAPEGAVLVGMAAERATLGDNPNCPVVDDQIARVGACYLDRYTVTNADFQHFVDAGGYDELEFWPEEALPALFEFVDATGCPGPRYWVDGRHREDESDQPVVGVSWYEAAAYARWVGKRLPTDAEWTKACAWPIESSPGRIAQRRYPWGESFDARRANLWSAGNGEPVDVGEFPDGVTVGGLEQMIGNVWEWTNDPLDKATPNEVGFPSALRCIRGGAYNTYFENQATCHYQSGEHPLARRANIGVRLALDMADLATHAS